MKYPVAEKFKAPQGEGLYTGTPMAFIRFVGCSVGHKVCTECDTNFDKMLPEMGGGAFSPEELQAWIGDYKHICLTGGEPLDRDLVPFLSTCYRKEVHIESSGTVDWSKPFIQNKGTPRFSTCYLTISPKPGYIPHMIYRADEVKVILGGLGEGEGWPTLEDALRWAKRGKTVYVQPRNDKMDIRSSAMQEAIDIVTANPSLRLSAQLHKYIRTR